jgi:hypothetical protein
VTSIDNFITGHCVEFGWIDGGWYNKYDNKRYIQQANENDSYINGNNENINTKYCLRKKRSAITFSKKYFV